MSSLEFLTSDTVKGDSMKNIGLILRQARLQQNIKQVNLAKGICSVSYLSKIENNQIQPNQEIVSELLKKLSMTINEVSYEEELSFLENTQKLYKEAVLYRNKKIENEVRDIEHKKIIFNDQSNSLSHLLMLSRIYITKGNELTKVQSVLDYIELQEVCLSNYQRCLLNISKCLNAFYQEQYPAAVEYIEMALEFHHTIMMEDWEKADLYNVLAICYLMNNYNYSAIEFARKALNIYRELVISNRVIDCYINLGIGYKRNFKYKESEESYQVAYLLLKDRELFELEGILTQNLGTLFAVQGDSEKSIAHFKKSLESNKTTEGYLITIFSIVKEYSKLKDHENVLKWCKKGLNLQEIDCKQNYSYYYHFMIFKMIHEESHNLTTVLVKAIKYFESKEDYRHVQKYATLLAKHYFEVRKMKRAGIYFLLANQALLTDRKLLKWEDL